MKKTLKSAMLVCLTVFVLLSIVSCEILSNFIPFEGGTTSQSETTAESTPDATTPEATTPEATTPEATTPEVTTPEITTPEITTPEITTPEITTPEITTPEITTPEITTPEITTPENNPGEEPPVLDFGGYVYRAYVRSNEATGGNTMQDGNPQFYCEDFWYNYGNNGEPEDALSYAVYSRNAAIEQTLNIKIEQVNQTKNMAKELREFAVAGEAFDLTIILAKSGAQAATMGLLQDLNSLPGLMLEQPTYDQNSIRELSIAGKLYYLSGDMNISTMDCITPTVINMEFYNDLVDAMVEHFGDVSYADIYNVVASGKWTIETMLEMAAIASVDCDLSDGALGASWADRVGYYQYATSTLYYFYGAGGRLTKINEDGVPEFVIQESQNQEVFDYLFQNMNKHNRDIPYPYGWSSARKANFITNANTLFTDMTLWDIRKDLYFNACFEYGILPTPTYEEGGDYHSVVHFSNLVHLWAIPELCNDDLMAQIMMATMSAASDITIPGSTMDAYYTRTLSFTVAPNVGARQMMDIIKNSTVYDIGLLYDWGDWVQELEKLGECYYNNYGTLVSYMPIGAIPKLEETIEQFRNPGGIIN